MLFFSVKPLHTKTLHKGLGQKISADGCRVEIVVTLNTIKHVRIFLTQVLSILEELADVASVRSWQVQQVLGVGRCCMCGEVASVASARSWQVQQMLGVGRCGKCGALAGTVSAGHWQVWQV